MKKLIVLLFIPLVFSCSDDDDNSNQTFLERYDGVVWEEEYDNLDTFRIMFTNNPLTSTEAYFNEENVILQWLIVPIDGFYYIDTINRLEVWPDGLSEDNWNAWEVSENGNIMTRSDSNGQINYLVRTTLTDPCE